MSVTFTVGGKAEAAGDRGVMTTAHPVVQMSVALTNKTSKLKAGTILRRSGGLDTYEPASESDDPVCVLVEDSDEKNGIQRAAFHGVAVKSRLIDASGAKEKPATSALLDKLPKIGIWVVQEFEGKVK